MNHLICNDFPLLQHTIHGYQLCYVDSASTSQKPRVVIDALVQFYTTHNANIHRGSYTLGEQATILYEQARAAVSHFIGARHSAEIIFTRGTTESINAVATMLSWGHIKAGDSIVVTELEHHANLLPWQRLAHYTGAQLNIIPVNADGTLSMETLSNLITAQTKLVAFSHVSNALGTRLDVATLIRHARSVGALTLIDAAQSVPYQPINVQEMDTDFLVFSGHKMCGPTGIGVLYIKQALHSLLEPYQVGGGMVFSADLQQATWLSAPQKFEAGTPPIAQAIGLAAAIDYLQTQVGFADLQSHTALLCARLIDGLVALKKIRILGPAEQLKTYGHLVSFVVDGVHGHDVVAHLDQFGICARAGHHCAQPLALALKVDASVRVSFYVYNTIEDVDRILQALERLIKEL